MIERADTFFLGPAHPSRGADASHRAGTPGFVRVTGDGLWWPDHPGNNVFNSLGTLTVDDLAALLRADFTTGDTPQLSCTPARRPSAGWHPAPPATTAAPDGASASPRAGSARDGV